MFSSLQGAGVNTRVDSELPQSREWCKMKYYCVENRKKRSELTLIFIFKLLKSLIFRFQLLKLKNNSRYGQKPMWSVSSSLYESMVLRIFCLVHLTIYAKVRLLKTCCIICEHCYLYKQTKKFIYFIWYVLFHFKFLQIKHHQLAVIFQNFINNNLSGVYVGHNIIKIYTPLRRTFRFCESHFSQIIISDNKNVRTKLIQSKF